MLDRTLDAILENALKGEVKSKIMMFNKIVYKECETYFFGEKEVHGRSKHREPSLVGRDRCRDQESQERAAKHSQYLEMGITCEKGRNPSPSSKKSINDCFTYEKQQG